MSLTSPIVEFGFGHGPADPNPVWVDCSEFVRAEPIPIQRGRTPDSSGIQAGTATLVLENLDGRFDPENTEGPYYGKLIDGTPVRIRVTFGGVTEDIWRGWVEAWPVTDTEGDSVVVLDCLDILGSAAQSGAPPTALEAVTPKLPVPPDVWWTVEPEGWVEKMRGLAARHTGGLVKMDPLVNGDEETFGSEGPDGYAEIVQPGAATGSVSGPISYEEQWTVVSVWTQLSTDRVIDTGTGWKLPVILYWEEAAFSPAYPGSVADKINVSVTHEGIRAWKVGHYGYVNATSVETSYSDTLFDGKPHHVVVALREAAEPPVAPDTIEGRAIVWVDGQRHEMWVDNTTTWPSSVDATFTRARIGSGPYTSVWNGYPYQGAIDHVMVWGEFPVSNGELDTLVATLYDAGRGGWANQRLDERATSILRAIGVDSMKGTFDTSGIVTLHSYRQANVLELLQKIEDTEQGRIWVDRHGLIRYSARSWYWRDTTATTDQAWFSDDPADLAAGAIGYLSEGLVVSRDPRKTTNVAQVTSEFGRMQTVRDQDSIDVRGERNPIHLSGLLHRSDRQSMTIARWLIQTRSEPKTRIEQLTFHVDDDPAKCVPFACTVEEGWRCKITRKGVDYLAHVIGIAHEIGPEGWRVTLFLDSTLAGYTWFRADISETDGPDLVAF